MPMNLPHLKIGQRLAVSYGTVILLLIATTFVGIGKLGALSATTDDALKGNYPKIILVNQVIANLGMISRAMRDVLILNDQAELEEQLDDINMAEAKMTNVLSRLERQVGDPQGKELLGRIKVLHAAYVVKQDDFVKLATARKMAEAKNLLLTDLYGYQNTYGDLLKRLDRDQGDLMDQASREVDETYHMARNLMYALVAVAVLLSVGITFVISRSLLRQLGGEPDYATAIARRIAAGDLASNIAIGKCDRSSLLYAMAGMRDSLIERGNALQGANRALANTIQTLEQAQEDLVRSQKLAALGALVAGIAHELNTPIGNGIMAASALSDLTRDFSHECGRGMPRSRLDGYLADVTEAGGILLRNLNRAGQLVNGFKQVAVDRETSQFRRFLLADVIGEILMMLQPAVKKTPFVVTQDIPKDIEMNSYPGPLGQVVTNMVGNALLHGLEGRASGTVSISARQLDGGYVELSVHDQGVGIPADNLNRIFDPFFTTKLGAGGSGLGLHIAYNIVNGILAGKIKVISEVNVGTTFVMTLPLDAIPAQDEAARTV